MPGPVTKRQHSQGHWSARAEVSATHEVRGWGVGLEAGVWCQFGAGDMAWGLCWWAAEVWTFAKVSTLEKRLLSLKMRLTHTRVHLSAQSSEWGFIFLFLFFFLI